MTDKATLAEENEDAFDGIISEHGLFQTSIKKCLSEDIDFTYFTVKCNKYESGEAIDECATGMHNCQSFESCINIDTGYELIFFEKKHVGLNSKLHFRT